MWNEREHQINAVEYDITHMNSILELRIYIFGFNLINIDRWGYQMKKTRLISIATNVNTSSVWSLVVQYLYTTTVKGVSPSYRLKKIVVCSMTTADCLSLAYYPSYQTDRVIEIQCMYKVHVMSSRYNLWRGSQYWRSWWRMCGQEYFHR